MSKGAQTQARNWCFTLNNYTDEEVEEITENTIYQYLTFGFEVGEKQTAHLQGYIEMGKCVKIGTMKKLNGRAHWEPRRGTQKQAIDYCHKDGDIVEIGVPANNKPGRRNDLDEIRLMALNEGMREVTSVGNAQQIRVAEKFLEYNEEPRKWETEVIWLYGKTGVGKSRMARELCDSTPFVKNSGNKWFTGYDGHENVIFDDFRDGWWPLNEMLSLLDRYEKVVETKGGQRQFKPKRIIVTTPEAPETHYDKCGERIDQLLRRITYSEEIKGPQEKKVAGEKVAGVGGNTKPRPNPQNEYIDEIMDKEYSYIGTRLA